MSKVVGTGCMLSSLIGAFCGANENNILDATAAAVVFMGLAGEIAFERLQEIDGGVGVGTYRTCLIDAISKINWEIFKNRMKIEKT